MTPEPPAPRSPRPARAARVHVAPLWHALPPADALAALGTAAAGLDTVTVERRLATCGPNRIAAARGDGPLAVLVRQVHNPLIYVLLASTALAIATGKVFDGLVILGVVVLNTLIGFVQEYRAGQAIEALSALVPQTATVLRDRRRQSVDAAGLVPGDIVVLQSGDKVPADLRLIETRSLLVEEAALTGESVPAQKAGLLSSLTNVASQPQRRWLCRPRGLGSRARGRRRPARPIQNPAPAVGTPGGLRRRFAVPRARG